MARITRRQFLKSAAVAAGGAAAPFIVPSSVFGGPAGAPPSGKITVGVIGCGIMGDRLRRLFSAIPDSTVVAVCDVNNDVRQRVAEQTPGVKLFSDFRELLALDEVDAVVIGTPHHAHAFIAVAAAKAGKDIYCEKPLTHTIHESRVVTDTVRRYGRVLQVGTHRRAGMPQRRGVELVRNQRMGKLHTIRVYTRPGLTREAAPVAPTLPVPQGFAWDLWLGPAPWLDFCGVHQKRTWNLYSDYSTGEITMTDCHILDAIPWAAGQFLQGPIEIEGSHDPEPNVAYRVTFKYANGVNMIVEARAEQPLSKGVRFEGTEGWVHIDVLNYRMYTDPPTLSTSAIGADGFRLAEMKHYQNEWGACCLDFAQSVKTRAEPLCPVEGGHKMTVLSDLVWIAPRLGRKLKWDDAAERFIGDDDANRLLHYAYRSPWTL